jgi:hypothetical protein
MNVRRFTFGHLPRLTPLCKHALVLCVVGAMSMACAGGARSESRAIVALDGESPVELRISLSAARALQRASWTDAATAAVRHHVRVLGTAPAATITITDEPVNRDRSAPARRDVIAVAAPLLSSRRGLAVEAAVARSVSLAFWRAAVPCGADRQWFVDGLARYTATVSLAAQHDGAREPAAIGMLEPRYAGGLLPWVLRTPVPAWTAGHGVSAYRSHLTVDPARARSAIERDAVETKTALAMQTLSNWVGSPTWEAVLRSFAGAAHGGCASWRDLQASAYDVTGLDLSWFFEQAFGSARTFDYGVERLTSERVGDAPDRYRTELVVRRYGDAVFSGTSEPSIEPFESGRGVEIAVRFADGTERVDYWDGRASSRRFEYTGANRAVSAVVDPRQIIVLDQSRTNNSRTLAPRAGAAATRWSILWSVWLQHLLLSYGSLV